MNVQSKINAMPPSKRAIVQSVNGVYIPPRKKFKPEKTLVLRFTITGTVYSQKNRLVADRRVDKILASFKKFKEAHRGAVVTDAMMNALQHEILEIKPIVRPTKVFMAWADSVRPTLIEQAAKWKESYAKDGLTYPITCCSISLYHFWKDNKVRDTDNRLVTVNDLLKKAGIISDDAWQNERRGTFEADLYPDILTHITQITLCAHKW